MAEQYIVSVDGQGRTSVIDYDGPELLTESAARAYLDEVGVGCDAYQSHGVRTEE